MLRDDIMMDVKKSYMVAGRYQKKKLCAGMDE